MANFHVESHAPEDRKNILVLRLEGSLDASSLERVEKCLDEMSPGKNNIIVNCRKLKFISSAGLGLFLERHGRLEGQGGKVVFAEVLEPEVHDAMNLLGFFDVFSIHDTELQAIQKAGDL